MTDTAPAEQAPARVRASYRIELAEDALDWAIEGDDEGDYRKDGDIVILRLADAAELSRKTLSPVVKYERFPDTSTLGAIATFAGERHGITPEQALARICRIVKIGAAEPNITEAVAA